MRGKTAQLLNCGRCSNCRHQGDGPSQLLPST